MADPIVPAWADSNPTTHGDVTRDATGNILVTMRAIWQGSVFWHRRINLGATPSKLMVRETMTTLHGEALAALGGMS